MGRYAQYEEFDPESFADWSGLTWVGLTGLTKVYDPTSADFEEAELWEDDKEIQPARGVRVRFDFDRCYKLAEVGSTAVEVAQIMGVETYIVHNNIRARFNCGWKEYAGRAKAALDGEVKRKMIELVRKGNEKVLLKYADKFLGWDAPTRVEITGKDGGPMQQQTVLLTLSDEELEKKRKALAEVIDRKKRFEGSGIVTPTLELVS